MIDNKKLLEFKNKNNLLRNLVNLFTLHCSQFVYKGLPETIPAEFLEFYLAINGTVGLGKVKELGDTSGIYATVGAYNGDINGYLPQGYTGAVTGLGEITGDWYGDTKTVVVGINNTMRAPEWDIPFTAEVLSQVDISERSNVIFTRMARLPYADNDTQKTALESAIKSIVKGDVFAVANRNVKNKFDEFLEGAKDKEDKFLDLVDVDRIDGLQYLNQYRDNVLKRFLSRRGYMVQTTSKLAQQTNAEIHGSDSFSLLYPLEQLECRKTMCENINSLFGLSVSVEFNPVLRKVYESYMSDPEEQSEEQSEEQTEEVDNNDQNS